MTRDLIERSRKRHALADVALLVTTAALVLSLAVAVTAVSIGIARADTLGGIADSNGGRFALVIVIVVVLAIAGMGGLAAVMVHDDKNPPRRD